MKTAKLTKNNVLQSATHPVQEEHQRLGRQGLPEQKVQQGRAFRHHHLKELAHQLGTLQPWSLLMMSWSLLSRSLLLNHHQLGIYPPKHKGGVDVATNKRKAEIRR